MRAPAPSRPRGGAGDQPAHTKGAASARNKNPAPVSRERPAAPSRAAPPGSPGDLVGIPSPPSLSFPALAAVRSRPLPARAAETYEEAAPLLLPAASWPRAAARTAGGLAGPAVPGKGRPGVRAQAGSTAPRRLPGRSAQASAGRAPSRIRYLCRPGPLLPPREACLYLGLVWSGRSRSRRVRIRKHLRKLLRRSTPARRRRLNCNPLPLRRPQLRLPGVSIGCLRVHSRVLQS